MWSSDINYCEDLVYLVSVTNYRDSPVKCYLNFKEDSDFSKPNVYFPRGGFKVTVQNKQQRNVLTLHKIDPSIDSGDFGSEISKLVTEFFFKEKLRK